MNLVEILSEQVRQRPAAPAILETRRGAEMVTTFGALDERSRRVAALLREAGLRAGDPVLIFHPMSAELYAVLLGVFRLGAVATFLDPAAGREHIERCCELQPPRALIASPKAHLLRLTCGALRRIPHKFVIGPWLPGTTPLSRADGLSPGEHCEPCTAASPALLTFTSGSTGQPKAAVRTHGFLLTQHRVLERHLKLAPGEVDLTTLPIFLLANLASGVTSVIPDADLRRPGFIEPNPVLHQMRRLQVTRAAGSPAFFERLLAGTDAAGAFGGMRKIYTGGAPVFPKLLRRLQAAAPQAEVEAVYGSTEAEPIAHVAAAQLSEADHAAMLAGQGLLAGAPIPEIQVAVLRDQWGRSLGPLRDAEFAQWREAPGNTGEIVVTGGHVLQGYLHGRGDAETKFRVGDTVWHRTGDAGRFDAHGRLWLLGRCAAKIEDRHGCLYPFAVECVAQEQSGIRRAALVADAGRRVLAIEPEGALAATALQSLREQLAWAQIAAVRSFPALPVDPRHNAKIDYPALRRLLAEAAR
jgi:acyl-CoA synthetase (AMP-forming)/AMP-acid ligase II